MMEFCFDNLIFVVLYPLWVFLLIGVGRFFAVKMSRFMISFLTILGSVLGLLCSMGAFPVVFQEQVLSPTEFTFIKINDLALNIGISIDKISLVCLTLLFLVSLLVQVYSISYMRLEKKFYRFFAYLNLFTFAMSALFVAPNLFQLYIMWEIVGLVSYLFVGFKYTNPLKSFASIKVFLINRVGDVALLAVILSIMYIATMYSTPRFITLDFSDLNFISAITYAHTNETTFLILCMLFLLGAFVKSAQFPFQSWLLSAMKAPTPVSALIHSSTLVVAGVFLIIKLLPLFTLSATVMSVIAVVGIFTALYSSLCAVCQTNVKKVLAYSTSANLGLMMLAIGFGNVDLAIAYLIIHGLIKAAMFLSYGASNNEYSDKTSISLSHSFVFASILLSGLLFVPLNLKEMFYDLLKGNTIFGLEFLLVCLLASLYLGRLCALYYKNGNVGRNLVEIVVVWTLLFVSVALSPFVKFQGIGLPFIIALIGFMLAIVITLKNKKYKDVGFVYQWVSRGFGINKFYKKTCPAIYYSISRACFLLDTLIAENQLLLKLARFMIRISYWIEKNVFDIFGRILVHFVRFASMEVEVAQVKNPQTYITYGVLIVVSILVTILLTYSLIINNLGGLR